MNTLPNPLDPSMVVSTTNPLDPSMVVSTTNPNTPPAKQKLISPSCFTDRQLDILRGMALGETTESIAIALKVSPKTVEYHRMQMMLKLHIFDTATLVHYALATKLILPMFNVTFTEVMRPEIIIDVEVGKENQNWTVPLKRVVPAPPRKPPVYMHKKRKVNPNSKYAYVFGMA